MAENKKGIISTSQPVFLCAIYIPPHESPYFQEETFPNIEQEISHFQAQGNVLLMGDLNSRTVDKLDFIASQGTRFITGNNSLFPSHPPRQNWDLQVNAHGRQLLCSSVRTWLCTSSMEDCEETLSADTPTAQLLVTAL